MAEFTKTVAFDFWATTLEMSPYLLFGFFMAGVLSVFISAQLVERHLGGRGLGAVLKASAFGVPLPLCSCSVIPVTMSLHKHGASKGSAVSFLLSAPQTGVDSIFVTYSLLGIVFAVFRPIAALVTGVVGGLLVNIFDQPVMGTVESSPECTDECCSHNHKKNRIITALRYGFITLPRDIGKPMLVGLIVAAFISALVPDDYFASVGSGFLSMLVMMLLGIPVYVCATASVPIAAVLIAKGVSPGAVLVFLMTGPATNAASLVTIWNTLGRKTAVIYLATVAGSALICGLSLNAIGSGFDITVVTKPHWMLPAMVKYVSAVALFTILIFAILRRRSV